MSGKLKKVVMFMRLSIFKVATTAVSRPFGSNNVKWETSAKIPYWWCITSQIKIVILIGWKFVSTNQRHYPDLGSAASSVWNFCAHFSDIISQGKPSLASQKVLLANIVKYFNNLVHTSIQCTDCIPTTKPRYQDPSSKSAQHAW